LNGVGLAIAFGAGLISISSPCCLPLLPGYLGYLAGLSAGDPKQKPRLTLIAALLFVAGFGLVFVILGATASEIGALLLTYRLPATRLAGAVILAMGLVLVLEGRLDLFSRSGGLLGRWSGRGRLWTAPALGAAFALTWTPCIGPVLAAILTLAASTADLHQGVGLLTAYSLGLGLPFLALSLSVPKIHSWLRRLGRGMTLLQAASGALLMTMGLLLLSDRWLPLISPVLAWYAQARWPPI
jgi:cytochrome c-type biogenesis protein